MANNIREGILNIAEKLNYNTISEEDALKLISSLLNDTDEDKLEFFAGICCNIPVDFIGSGTWQCKICEKYHTPQQLKKSEIEKLIKTTK